MAPHQFPSLTSPLRSPFGNIKKFHCSSSILRPAKRTLLNESSLPIPEPHPETSIPAIDTQEMVSENSSDDILYSLNVAHMEPICQFQAATQPALDQDTKETSPEKSSTRHAGRTSQCTSFNITEFVKRHLNGDDLDEVQSPLDPAYIFVNGHKIKKENGSLLSAIFEKYGDIARESTEDKPPVIISLFLERTCAIFKRLKETEFRKLTQKDLDEMLDEVEFLESQKLNLGWLRKKLQYIKMSIHDYLFVKENEKRCDAMVAKLRNELDEAIAKSDEIKQMALNIKAKVVDLRTHSLVHGLL